MKSGYKSFVIFVYFVVDKYYNIFNGVDGLAREISLPQFSFAIKLGSW